MLYYERVKRLCEREGISMIALEAELGMPRGSIDKMKTSEPSFAKMCKFADRFGVSLDYFREEGKDGTV